MSTESTGSRQLCSSMLLSEVFIWVIFLLLTPLRIFCHKNVEKLTEETQSRFHSTHETSRRLGNKIPIPLLSVSLTTDSKNYLARLLDSIDYPVRSIIVQIGNNNRTIREEIISNATKILLSKPYLNVTITEGKRYWMSIVAALHTRILSHSQQSK